MKTESRELIKFEDWERLFNAAIDPLMLLDLDGNVITINEEAAKLLDKSVDELIGWNSYDFMAPNESKFFKAQINNIARLRKPARVEKELFGRTFDHSLSPIFDEQGKVEQIAFFSHDITERKKIEKQLRLKSSAIESSNNAIALADLEGKLIYVNPTFLKEWGYTNINEVIGKNSTSFWQTEEEASEVIKGLQNEGEFCGELVARRKNGKIFNTQVSASMVIDDNDEPICMMSSFINITERKRNKELLKESEKKYKNLSVELETVIDLIPGVVFCADKNGIITRINQNAANFNKLNKEDIIGKTIFNLFPEGQAKKMREDDLKVINSGKPLLNLEEMADTPYGKKWLITNKVPHYNEDNEIVGIIGLVIDITERKRAEELLKESKGAFQDAYNRILLYQDFIAHDIRNVLNNVQSLMYLYNRYRNNRAKMNKMNDVLKMISEQIVKGDKLIQNAIKLSNLETKQISLQPVDVLDVLEESIKFLHNSLLNRKISIQIDSVSNEFVAQADDFLIDVFDNILNNAVKHNTNPIAEILIRIAKEERGMKNYIQFEFIDNGNGIPDNRKQLIFQRNHPKKEYVKGLGIGLSLVFKIIENYGGEIWVEDKVKGDHSKGSKFVILIPEAY